ILTVPGRGYRFTAMVTADPADIEPPDPAAESAPHRTPPEMPPRHLAAILAADIAGYSRLMGLDQLATVRAREGHQAIMFPMIAATGGRIVNTAGDGLLAEFPSAQCAVSCAIAIQRRLAEGNRDVPADRCLLFRMGINEGDVIQVDDRSYGDVI